MHKLASALAITLITGNLTRVKAEQNKTSLKPGAVDQAKPGKKTEAAAMTLDELIHKLLQGGGNNRKIVQKGIAKNLGFTEDKPAKVFEVKAPNSADGWSHVVLIPWELVEEKEKSLAVIFSKIKKDREKLLSESQYYKLNMGGKLELSFTRNGKYTEEMKPIPGTAKDAFQDIESPSVREDLKREMDFWLKGMYRKPAAEESVSSEESAKPQAADKAPAKPASPSKTDQPKP